MKQKLIDLLLHKAGARFGAEGTDYSDFTSSKFAELIINECIDQVAGTKIVGQLSGDEFAELSESADNKYTIVLYLGAGIGFFQVFVSSSLWSL